MKTVVLLSTIALLLISCSDEAITKRVAFPTIIIEDYVPLEKSTQSSSVDGLYFGELEIIAYHYRPGESIQNHNGAVGFTGKDWSYFTILPSGYESARDIVLQNSGAINIAEYLEYPFDSHSDFYLNADYVSEIGEFRVDVFELVMYRTGVIANNSYYGMNANFNGHDLHPLHRYPELSSIPDFYAQTLWPGLEGNTSQNMNVMFAHESFISSPVQILLIENQNDEVVFTETSRTLSESESDFIKKLVSQGTSRRFYTYLNIIPFSEELIWDFSESEAPSITVKISLNDVVDMTRTDYTAIEGGTVGHPDTLFYKGNNLHIPFGLTIDF